MIILELSVNKTVVTSFPSSLSDTQLNFNLTQVFTKFSLVQEVGSRQVSDLTTRYDFRSMWYAVGSLLGLC